MRSSMLAVGLSAVVLAACGRNGAPSNRTLSDDLKRDLQAASSNDLALASQQAGKNFALTEIGQTSAPAPSVAPRKAPGPKAVRSKAPTVKATPAPEVTAESAEPQAEVATQTAAPTPTPTPEPEAPAVPRPSPTPVDPNAGVGTHGRNDGGSTAGTSEGVDAIIGTIFGAVIRGGVVDGDHCDPRTDGRRGRRGPGGWGGGIGSGTIPINPMTGAVVIRPRA